MSKAKALLGLAAVGLVAAAVAKELRKPAADRTWEGSLGGAVPYDFRPPTGERTLAKVWNPDDERIFTPHVFGVGWSVNVGRIARQLGLG